MRKIFSKIMFVSFIAIFILSLYSCDFSEDSKKSSNTSDGEITIDTPEGEKTYTITPLPDAEFFYFTESGKFYLYNNGEITQYEMTVTISQDGKADIIQTIIPVEFYRLGLYYNFEFIIESQSVLMNQIKGENTIYEVSSLWRHPDKIHVTMNNGRFSIEINTYDVYTVSDIRNLTLSTGITRTLLCSAYYLGDYTVNYDYGLFFVAEDDGLSTVTNGLYFYAEIHGQPIKIINEKGEMW